MDIIQECANNFRTIANKTSYVFHVSKNKNIIVLSLNFVERDFHHIAGLQYLTDIAIPRNKSKVISWILNEKSPITESYLSKSVFYNGRPNDEKDIEKRISELRYLEDYLDDDNIVYIYSPKDSPNNNSLISCDYIIKSFSEIRKETVFIFLKHRCGENSPCRIISFGVKKKVEYGGIYAYVMLKDRIIDGVRNNIFRHTKYTNQQIIDNEPDIAASYLMEDDEEYK